MDKIKDTINTLLSLLLVMLIISLIYYAFVIHRLVFEPDNDSSMVMTLAKDGRVIINGQISDYYLEETKVYKLRRKEWTCQLIS